MSNIIRWNPFFDSFDDDFSRLLERFHGGENTRQNMFMPAVDVYEDGDNVIVETQLAGVEPDKTEISVENDVLTIKGEGEKKTEVDDKNYYRKEIRSGSFYRNIPLPTHVDGDKASAEYDKGVLKISIPKRAEVKPTQIKISKK
ncbi:MAG: Hsp20/alpha crystallin family protein [bacterium]|nr:Hsp20/alpha crystallin family protein [bacterium]